MSNKITNDESFQNYIGKYITLEQNGVKKKYYVSEISKSSFLSNVSILQGVSGTGPTDFNFASAGVSQKCDACEFPCISAVPIIELIFSGRGLPASYYADIQYKLEKPYFDEKHVPVINNHNIGTIDLSVLSADFNVVWLIPSREEYNIDIKDVFQPIIDQSSPNAFSNKTTAFSAFFFDPAYYLTNDLNIFRIDHVYANNPLSSSGGGIPSEYNFEWFWGNFYDILYNYTPSRIIYKKLINDSTGNKTLTCYPWYLYELRYSEVNPSLSLTVFNSKEYNPPFGSIPLFGPVFYENSKHQQISCVFLDLNPCEPPSVEYYQYNLENYYTYFDTHNPYINYDAPYYPHPMLRKFDFFTTCGFLSPTSSLFIGRNLGKFGPAPWGETLFYHDSAATMPIQSATMYYSDEFNMGKIYYINISEGKRSAGPTLC